MTPSTSHTRHNAAGIPPAAFSCLPAHHPSRPGRWPAPAMAPSSPQDAILAPSERGMVSGYGPERGGTLSGVSWPRRAFEHEPSRRHGAATYTPRHAPHVHEGTRCTRATHAPPCAYTRTYAHTSRVTRARVGTHTHARTRKRGSTYRRTRIRAHAYLCTCMHTYAQQADATGAHAHM